MKQDKTSELIIRDLVKNGLVSLENADAVLPFIQGAYCAGYEYGKKIRVTGKEIVQLSLDGKKIEVYETALAAARKLGSHPDNICKAARGVQHTCKGFKWKYLEQYKSETCLGEKV